MHSLFPPTLDSIFLQYAAWECRFLGLLLGVVRGSIFPGGWDICLHHPQAAQTYIYITTKSPFTSFLANDMRVLYAIAFVLALPPNKES